MSLTTSPAIRQRQFHSKLLTEYSASVLCAQQKKEVAMHAQPKVTSQPMLVITRKEYIRAQQLIRNNYGDYGRKEVVSVDDIRKFAQLTGSPTNLWAARVQAPPQLVLSLAYGTLLPPVNFAVRDAEPRVAEVGPVDFYELVYSGDMLGCRMRIAHIAKIKAGLRFRFNFEVRRFVIPGVDMLVAEGSLAMDFS